MKDERQWNPPTLELIEQCEGDSAPALRKYTGCSLADCAAQMIADLDKRCGPYVDLTETYDMLRDIADAYAHRDPDEPFEAEEVRNPMDEAGPVTLIFRDAD